MSMDIKDPLSSSAENTTSEDNIPFEETVRAEDKMMGFIAYVPLGFLVPILLEKKSEFVQFHIRQGIILFAVWFLLLFIPVIGSIATFAYIIVIMVCGAQAYGGEKYEIPVISDVKKALQDMFNK